MHHGLVNWRAKGIRAPCPQLTFSMGRPQICRVRWDKLNLDSTSCRISIAMMSLPFWCFDILKARMFDYKTHWALQPRAQSAKIMFGNFSQGCKYGERGSGLTRFWKGVWRCNILIVLVSWFKTKANPVSKDLNWYNMRPELISWVPTWLEHIPASP